MLNLNIVTAIFEELDQDRSNYVGLQEFVDGYFIQMMQCEERVQELERNMDKDQSKRKQIADKLKDVMDE